MASRRASRKRVSVAAVAGDCFSNRFQGPVNGAESRKYNRPEARLPLRFQGCRTASRRCRAMPSPALIREADGAVPPPVLMPGRHEFRPRMHFLFRFHAASRLRPLRGGEASSAGNGAMRGMRQRATRGRGGARSDGGARPLVIVESPAKARTIGQFLGDGYRVMATRGHVRDLPAKAGSVKPEDGFAMVHETGRGAARTLGAMAKALRRADALVLATDPEREGEADAKAASSPSAGNMRPSAPEKETAACSSNEGTSSAVSPSPGGLSLVLAVVRLSGRSSPGVCRWAQSGQRLPGLDATPAARRTHAVGSLGAPAPDGRALTLRAARRAAGRPRAQSVQRQSRE